MLVLVVDDSPIDAMVLSAAVRRLGHESVTVHDAEAALGVLEQLHVDTVLTDWMMPGMSGLELCQEIRARANGRYVFTVIFTSVDRREQGLHAVRVGADKFLTKPLDMIALEMCLITAERVTAMQRELLEQKAVVDELNATLERQVRTDPLTGVGNRQRLDEDLAALGHEVARYGTVASIAMCDLDRFKLYNDRFGHQAGDQALRSVARVIEASCRDTDAVYRYGGEELCVLLPHQDRVHATLAVERLRAAVERRAIAHPDNEPFGIVTVSLGLAEVSTANPDPRTALRQADEALYAAKATGRNRLTVASLG